MTIVSFHIIWTVILVALFVGILYWSYSKSTASRFEAAANLPFDDDDDELDQQSTSAERTENKHE